MSKSTVIRQLINSHLLVAINAYKSNHQQQYILDEKIPLYQDRDTSRVLYISSVALQLSKSHNQKTMEIASGIASHLSLLCSGFFIIQVVSPGWIHLELTDSVLADWLQSLAVNSGGNASEEQGTEILIHKPKFKVKDPTQLFAVQYAHARCCSLVLLAHREGLIKLREPLPNMSDNFQWHFLSTEPIPWLQGDGKLCLNQPAESRLIAQLIQVVDDLECSDLGAAVNWGKAALNLSQAFEVFWSKCRIWGEVKITSPELAQARVGLLMATQSILRLLLVEKLVAVAPVEL